MSDLAAERDETTRLRERLDQFDAYAITVASALADREGLDAASTRIRVLEAALAAEREAHGETKQRLADGEAVVRNILTAYNAKLHPTRGTLSYSDASGSTGFIAAIHWLAATALAPQEDRP